MTAPLDDPLRRVADLPPPPLPGDHLLDLLKRVVDHEPPIGDAIADVFRRAEAVRRRRARNVLLLASLVVVICTIVGYAVTAVLLPASPTQSTAADLAVAEPIDPVLGVLAPVLRASGLRGMPRDPARGDGWRRYAVRSLTGRPHGYIEISTYTAPGGLCFPVLAAPGACARADRTRAGVEYVRYAFDRDIDWQVNEVMARRLPDGRVIVVQATGQRDAGTAQGGRPPLTALLAARVATDPATAAAFGVRERCNGPVPDCPVLRVPVPVRG